MTESETQHSAKKPNVRTPLNGVAPVLTPEGFIEKEWDCGCRVCTKLKVAALVAVELARKEQIEIAKETLLAYDLDLRNKIEEAKKQFYCKTCGFPKNMEREPVFLNDNALSFILYEDEKCLECGHQKNGWTIKALKPYIFELVKNVRKQEQEKNMNNATKFALWIIILTFPINILIGVFYSLPIPLLIGSFEAGLFFNESLNFAGGHFND